MNTNEAAMICLQHPYLTWKHPGCDTTENDIRFQSHTSTPNQVYHIDEVIGAGGCGVVFTALDSLVFSTRFIAIKTLRMRSQSHIVMRECTDSIAFEKAMTDRLAQFETWMTNPDSGARTLGLRLISEANKMAIIPHPAVVKIARGPGKIQFKSNIKLPYVEMEYIRGTDLEKIIVKSEKPKSPDDFQGIIRCGYRLASALATLHDLHIAHRDVKATNVRVPEGKTPDDCVLIDLGLARLDDDTALSVGDNGDRYPVGTVSHMPWEQLHPDPKWEAEEYPVDQFALGVLLYRWSCGVYPYEQENLRSPSSDFSPKSLSIANPSAPIVFADTVDRMLAKHPTDRFASMRDVMASMELAAKGLNFAAQSIVSNITKQVSNLEVLVDMRTVAKSVIATLIGSLHEIQISNDEGALFDIAKILQEEYRQWVEHFGSSPQTLELSNELAILSRQAEVSHQCKASEINKGSWPGKGLAELIQGLILHWQELDLDLARVHLRGL